MREATDSLCAPNKADASRGSVFRIKLFGFNVGADARPSTPRFDRKSKLELHNIQKNWRSLWTILAGALVVVIGAAGTPDAQANDGYTAPFPPFKIAGNLYYVGSRGLANCLITTRRSTSLSKVTLRKTSP